MQIFWKSVLFQATNSQRHSNLKQKKVKTCRTSVSLSLLFTKARFSEHFHRPIVLSDKEAVNFNHTVFWVPVV